jgi:autotransporter-associated beta strand protein
VLMMGANNALPTTKVVTTSANGTLDLNGYTTTVGSIAGTTGTITSGATTPTNLNVGGNDANFSYTGNISQSVRVVKQGTGDFTLGSAPQVATVTAGSPAATVTSTTGWYVGMPVAGPGIPSGTTVSAITGATGVILSNAATTAGTSITPANTNWAGIELQAGRVVIRDDANLGLVPNAATADNIAFSGGTLRNTQNVTLAGNRGITVNSQGGTVETDALTTLTANGIVSGSGQLSKIGNGTLSLTATNTHTGKVEVATGTLSLASTGSLLDSQWVEVKSGSTFNTSAVAGGANIDGTVSGTGTISGSLNLVSNAGVVNGNGLLAPGNASVNALLNAGDANGVLTITGNLNLTPASILTTRVSLTASAPTLNDAAGITAALLSNNILGYLNSQESAWNTASIGAHDNVKVDGLMTFNRNAGVVLTYSGYTPVFGDVFDFFDWGNVLMNDFRHGAGDGFSRRSGGSLGDLDLPALTSGLLYDMTLFNTAGIVVVIPEPSRLALMMLGALGFVLRRRRR